MEEIEAGLPQAELRFGYVTDLYYLISEEPAPKQLDRINEWFPSLIIQERISDGTGKEAPEFLDRELLIAATRYHDYLYNSGNSRVTQIAGRLVGTSASNAEKERKSAELIQKKLSRSFTEEMNPLPDLQEHVFRKLSVLNDETIQDFHYELFIFLLKTAEEYYRKDPYDRDRELFPFDEETFDQIVYNSFYQIQRYEFDGMVNAYLWLLIGSLLRNESGRVARVFDSGFRPLHKAQSENGTLLDKLRYLIDPEQYESYYEGDDLEKRFPGIEWFCDNCGDHLNEQEGFTDVLPVWQCRRCGELNRIEIDEIYENEEDAQNGIRRKEETDFIQAVNNRRRQLMEQERQN